MNANRMHELFRKATHVLSPYDGGRVWQDAKDEFCRMLDLPKDLLDRHFADSFADHRGERPLLQEDTRPLVHDLLQQTVESEQWRDFLEENLSTRVAADKLAELAQTTALVFLSPKSRSDRARTLSGKAGVSSSDWEDDYSRATISAVAYHLQHRTRQLGMVNTDNYTNPEGAEFISHAWGVFYRHFEGVTSPQNDQPFGTASVRRPGAQPSLAKYFSGMVRQFRRDQGKFSSFESAGDTQEPQEPQHVDNTWLLGLDATKEALVSLGSLARVADECLAESKPAQYLAVSALVAGYVQSLNEHLRALTESHDVEEVCFYGVPTRAEVAESLMLTKALFNSHIQGAVKTLKTNGKNDDADFLYLLTTGGKELINLHALQEVLTKEADVPVCLALVACALQAYQDDPLGGFKPDTCWGHVVDTLSVDATFGGATSPHALALALRAELEALSLHEKKKLRDAADSLLNLRLIGRTTAARGRLKMEHFQIISEVERSTPPLGTHHRDAACFVVLADLDARLGLRPPSVLPLAAAQVACLLLEKSSRSASQKAALWLNAIL